MESTLTVKVGADIAGLKRELDKATTHLGGFNKQMSAIGSQISSVFAGIGIAAAAGFSFEMMKLSGEAQGVKAAFDRLPGSIKLLEDLKTATGGTVSELSLMKRAVQASNFDIELSALPKLLQFATLRAQQTGQSVDYLVDSIVMGIGRKSKLILDNLGISAVALGEKLKGISPEAATVGDVAKAVGQIAEESLSNMAGFSENASTKVQRLEASWINFKIALGDAANSSGILGTSIDGLSKSLDLLSAKQLSVWEKLGMMLNPLGSVNAATQVAIRKNKELVDAQKKQESIIRQVDHAYKDFGQNIDAYGRSISTHRDKTALLAEYQKRLVSAQVANVKPLENITFWTEKLNKLKEQQLVLTGRDLANTNREIEAIEKKIKKLKELGLAQGSIGGFSGDLTRNALGNPFETKNQVAVDAYNQSGLEAATEAIKKNFADQQKAMTEHKTKMMEFGAYWVEHWANVGMAAINAAPIINEAFIALGTGLGEALGNMASGIGGAEQITGMLLGVFGNMAIQLGQLAIATGIAVIGIKKALMSLNPAVAIAAGVALVALGTMVSNKAKSIASGGGGGGSIGSAVEPRRPDRIAEKDGERIVVDVNMKVRGSDLVSVINEQGRKDSKTKGR